MDPSRKLILIVEFGQESLPLGILAQAIISMGSKASIIINELHGSQVSFPNSVSTHFVEDFPSLFLESLFSTMSLMT